MTDEIAPLELLDQVARRHGCRVGVVSRARGATREIMAGKLERLEVRNGCGFWARRELIQSIVPGKRAGVELDLDLEEAAEEMIDALGRQGWLDEDPA